MSSKIGLLISLVFFTMFFLLSIDIICIQFYMSDLDSKSTIISYEISRLSKIDNDSIKNLEDKYQVSILNISNRTPNFGDVVSFTIEKDYRPIIVSNDEMEIKIERSTVIGYY